jgi:signal transduction protein with GAF and PtsI domain
MSANINFYQNETSELDSELIVLARTTRKEFKKKIGKAFYQKGYGLTGWIFEKRRPLQIKDMQNKDELEAIDKNLEWTDKYKGGEYRFSGKRRKMPFLGVPLIKGNSILGVIRVGDSLKGDSFPAYAQDVLMSFAGILSNLIEKIELIEKQMKSIERLVKIGSTRDRQEVFDSIVKQASTLVNAENCELYTLDKFGEKIVLQATTGGYMQELKRTADAKLYQRGDGLTGWVFKTGKPLFIKNYLMEKKLTMKIDGLSG